VREYDVRILVPMVTLAEDMAQIRRQLADAAGIGHPPPLGAMIETPAELDAIPSLLRFGIRTLSVAPPLVPSVKEAIRQTSLQTT